MPQNEPRASRPEVAEGMAAARDRGVRLGRPPAALPEGAPRAAELRAAGNSLAQIAAALNAEQVATPSGRGQWTKSSVQYVLTRYDQERAEEA
ncbi:recombinase family protein [Dactylosporangium sp. NPDC051485]|uniref:recombinase family protein n=1 Tax=Dactylosporangium sp. NPDC051485 TaxID=3154846 RepID=UPI0034386CE2